MPNVKKPCDPAKIAANFARLEKMRANLARLESIAAAILEKGDAMTDADRLQLITLVNVAYHDGGKIETITSLDGSCTCDFCEIMRDNARRDPTIICGLCYAARDAYKEASWRRHQLNARILSTVLFTETELSLLAVGTLYGRINEDGDIVNETHARNVLRFIRIHSASRFGFWYKNAPAVRAGIAKEGKPANVTMVKSSVHIGKADRPDEFTDIVFTVYPDESSLEEAIRAGAVQCNGRKCMHCLACYDGIGNGQGVRYVAELLRCSKAQRAAILDAIAGKAGN